MKHKQAINILIKQREKLTDQDLYKDENWVFQTASYIKDFFGEESPEYSFISKFTFSALVSSAMTNDQRRYEIDSKKDKALQYLNNCIETIESKGLYKLPKTNILQNLDNLKIFSFIGGIILFCGSVGYYFGTQKIDLDKNTLVEENKILKDSLLSVGNTPEMLNLTDTTKYLK